MIIKKGRLSGDDLDWVKRTVMVENGGARVDRGDSKEDLVGLIHGGKFCPVLRARTELGTNIEENQADNQLTQVYWKWPIGL